jgi:hypothetical protein
MCLLPRGGGKCIVINRPPAYLLHAESHARREVQPLACAVTHQPVGAYRDPYLNSGSPKLQSACALLRKLRLQL